VESTKERDVIVMTLEAPDQQIGLTRAAALAGLDRTTLRMAAADGRLEAVKVARDWLTTRRQLHGYLAGRKSHGFAVKPLPADYETPNGEEPIG
jgi:hypothetical protein